jgi:hypothetical protein
MWRAGSRKRPEFYHQFSIQISHQFSRRSRDRARQEVTFVEIQALRAQIPEDMLTRLATEALPPDVKVKDVRVHLKPEGAQITGAYEMFFAVPFETLWELSVRDGKILARLANVKVARLGAEMVKGVLLGTLDDAAKQIAGLQLHGDTLIVDVDRILASRGYPVRTNLKTVRCQAGSLLIESEATG